MTPVHIDSKETVEGMPLFQAIMQQHYISVIKDTVKSYSKPIALILRGFLMKWPSPVFT